MFETGDRKRKVIFKNSRGDTNLYLDIQNVVHPSQLLKINFFFRPEIANTINPSTSTLFFDQKLLLYKIVIFINAAVDFQDLNSTCDQSYMRNCNFEHFVSTHFGHSHQAPSSPHQAPAKSLRTAIAKQHRIYNTQN